MIEITSPTTTTPGITQPGRPNTDRKALQISITGIKKTSGNLNRVTGSKKIFILFHRPLDGEQFKYPKRVLSMECYGDIILL